MALVSVALVGIAIVSVAWKECGLKIHGENHMESTTSSTGQVFARSGAKEKAAVKWRPPDEVKA